MVKGIEKFREYFSDYAGQYVFIGGTACDIILGTRDVDFRVTKDLDIVLVMEALDENFVRQFISFIKDGGYRHIKKGTAENHLKPYPKLGEEFSKWLSHYSNFTSVISGGAQKKNPVHSVPEVFDVYENESYKKCVIEFISGMTDEFAIKCFEEIITF